jgi:hypothetical protein
MSMHLVEQILEQLGAKAMRIPGEYDDVKCTVFGKTGIVVEELVGFCNEKNGGGCSGRMHRIMWEDNSTEERCEKLFIWDYTNGCWNVGI